MKRSPKKTSFPKSARAQARSIDPLHREQGSAYIVTLMVLFVLTALGLSLTLITSTESTLGAQERTIQRTFYAADSGLGLALSALMSRNDCDSRCVNLDDDSPDMFNSNDLIDQIEISKMAALDDRPTALGQINDSDFRNVNHYVAARSTRVIPDNLDAIPVGQRTVAQMFALDPWVSPGGCFVDVFVPCSSRSSLTQIPPP